MPATTISQADQAAAIKSAAEKYAPPGVKAGQMEAILVGVYGLETAFGKNIATSSAGAVGPFQFTAADKGTGVTYPMTNTPTLAQFQQQADAAAAYLNQLYTSHSGDWNSALTAYSGNGYGLTQVGASWNSSGGKDLLGKVAAAIASGGAIQTGVGAVGNAISSTADFLKLITSQAFLIRLGEVIAGMILLAMGLRSLTGAAAG
jgi:hypothetical protein